MTPALGREAGRLRRAFTRAAWIAFAAAQAGAGYVACGGGATGGSTSDQGGKQQTASASQTGSGGGGGATTDPSGSGGGNDKCAPRPFTVKDAGDDCGVFLRLPCGLPKSATPEPECYLAVSDCPDVCGMLAFNCHTVNDNCVDGAVVTEADKPVDVDCTICANGVGRAPEGFMPRGGRQARANVGAFVALAAELEAASVFAFDRLAAELTHSGAPPRLVGEARRAARDERRHARRTTRVARDLGGAPVRTRRAGEAAAARGGRPRERRRGLRSRDLRRARRDLAGRARRRRLDRPALARPRGRRDAPRRPGLGRQPLVLGPPRARGPSPDRRRMPHRDRRAPHRAPAERRRRARRRPSVDRRASRARRRARRDALA